MSTLKAATALGAMFLALLLIGCSDDPSPAATPTAASTVAVAPTPVDTPASAAAATPTPAAVETPTPVAQAQAGAKLTTQEYAEALEEATSGRVEEGDDEIEAAFETIYSSISDDMFERMSSLESSESWSEDDIEFASEFAKTILQASTSLYDVILRVFNEYLAEISSLRPPAHLADLHSNFTATYREVLQFIQDYMETVKNTDTEIKSLEDYSDFQDIIISLESGPLDQRSEDLTEQAEQACLALKEQLEAELERDVSICD